MEKGVVKEVHGTDRMMTNSRLWYQWYLTFGLNWMELTESRPLLILQLEFYDKSKLNSTTYISHLLAIIKW